MKLSHAAIVGISVVACSFAFAQEESPTPSEKLNLRATDPSSQTEPSVVVPSEHSSTSYPKPGTPLKKRAKPAPEPSETPSPVKASSHPKSTPVPAKTTAASPSPAAVPKAAEPAVKALENRWLAALQTHDSATVQALVADDYIGVTATGTFVTKSGLLGGIKSDKNNYASATNTHMEVRVHGDAAVIVGTTRQTGKDTAGKAFTYQYRWTDTWARRDGEWLCVASQSIQVPK